jgi:hypothetical protein
MGGGHQVQGRAAPARGAAAGAPRARARPRAVCHTRRRGACGALRPSAAARASPRRPPPCAPRPRRHAHPGAGAAAAAAAGAAAAAAGAAAASAGAAAASSNSFFAGCSGRLSSGRLSLSPESAWTRTTREPGAAPARGRTGVGDWRGARVPAGSGHARGAPPAASPHCVGRTCGRAQALLLPGEGLHGCGALVVQGTRWGAGRDACSVRGVGGWWWEACERSRPSRANKGGRVFRRGHGKRPGSWFQRRQVPAPRPHRLNCFAVTPHIRARPAPGPALDHRLPTRPRAPSAAPLWPPAAPGGSVLAP